MNIDGVILTPEALQRLRLLQEEDNDLLKSHTKDLFNVVQFIVRDSDYFSGNKEKMKETLRMADSLFYLTCANIWKTSLQRKKKHDS
jgi:hypothetical protein